MSEWLRRWTRNPLGSARRGSNPLGVVSVSRCMNHCSLFEISTHGVLMISVNRPPLSRHIHVKTPIERMRHNLTVVYNRLAFLSTSSPLSPSRGLHVFTLVQTFHCAHIPRRPEVGSERSPCAFTAVAQATRHQIASPHFPPELLPACYFNMVDKMLLSQSFKSLLHGTMV